MNGVIETATGDLLRAGFCDFATDGSFNPGTETIRTDVPRPAMIRRSGAPGDHRRWDGGAWVLVPQPNDVPRLWDHVAPGVVHALPEHVNFTSPAEMATQLLPSITIDLHGRVSQIEWMDPTGAVAADNFEQRYTGDVVVRETHLYTEGAFGPTERADTLVAVNADATDGETWTRTRRYRGMRSKAKGDKIRQRTVDRLAMWVAAGGATCIPPKTELDVAAWAKTVSAEIDDFVARADPTTLIAHLDVQADPMFVALATDAGIDVVEPSIGGTDTVGDALVASLSTWLPA